MKDKFINLSNSLPAYFLVLNTFLLVGCTNLLAESTTPPLTSSVPTAIPIAPSPDLTPGQVTVVERPGGTYLYYLPTTLAAEPEIVVIAHGTPGKKEEAVEVAAYYLRNWLTLAEERGTILIAPAFDQENFGGREGPLGGYRGLLGRHIGADEFVLQIVDEYRQRFDLTEPRFYLYGHSAGGQFVGRFIVRHPERVKRAVISAAATYPSPDPAVAWPDGMGKLHTTVRWEGAQTAVMLDFQPDTASWLKASTLPVTVVVGLNDTEAQPDRPGQMGNTRLVVARNWVRAMQALAEQHGLKSTIELSMVPGLGHSAGKLLPYCQAALFP